MKSGTIDLSDALTAARALLGAFLVREIDGAPKLTVRIVETEAYLPDDPASHSFSGPTKRNASMFGPAGLAYVYRIHRVVCLNVVTGPAGTGEAVLVRAVEPIEGREHMEANRSREAVGRVRSWGYDLCNGPGKLCQALGIQLRHDGTPLVDFARFESPARGVKGGRRETMKGWKPPQPIPGHSISLQPAPVVAAYERTVRIGISKAKEERLRFVIPDSPWLSRRIDP